MSMNDFTYLAVIRVREAELEASAAKDRLVRDAREAARERRLAAREARWLELEVHGPRPGLVRRLRNWLAADGSVADSGRNASAAGSQQEAIADESTETTSVGAESQSSDLIKAGC
jgi:hypothetical protein